MGDTGRSSLTELTDDHSRSFPSEILWNVLIQSSEKGVSALTSDKLSAREREVTRLLAEWKNNKQVATALALSARTVETHRANIMRKLEITSIVELVHYAVRHQVIHP
jgi:DNA-binding NarL/FixJ family response regulator